MNTILIKIGGSLLYNDKLAFNFDVIKKFTNWFKNQEHYNSCIFVVGGGKLSRFITDQAKSEMQEDHLRHRIGLKVTQVNSALVHGLFGEKESRYFENMEDLLSAFKENQPKISIIGGTRIGGSTDTTAAEIASNLGISFIYKVSNIDYIYTNDPTLDANAKPYEKLSWEQYIKLFEEKFSQGHKPGMNIPVDFKCASFAQENGLCFRVCGGIDLDKKEFGEVLNRGTVIE